MRAPGSLGLLFVVLTKELRETLRDVNSLLFSVLFPALFFPMVIWLFTQVDVYMKGQAEPPRIEVQGDVPLPVGAVRVGAGEPADAVARRVGDVVTVEFRSTVPASQRALDAVRSATAEQWPIKTEDLAPDRNEGFAQALARAVPLLLVIFGMLGGLYPAVEAVVAEQERGTVETTLLTATPRWIFFAGKLGSVLFMALLALGANMVAIGVTFAHLLVLMEAELQFPLGRLLSTLPMAVTVTVFTAAASLLAASPTRSFKQAQNTTSAAATTIMALAGLGMIPGNELSPGWSLVPITNAVLVMSEQIAGRPVGVWGWVAGAELLVGACLVLAASARIATRGGLT